MQMQPINPLDPLVAGAKKTQPNSGKDFNDCLLSARNNSAAVPKCEPEMTAKQDDEVHADVDPMPADGLAGPVATLIQGMVAILPGQNSGTAVLTDLAASNFMQQTVAEMPYPNSENGLIQAVVNHTAPQVSLDSASANSAILSQTIFGKDLPDKFLTTPPQDSETTLLQVHSKPPHSPALDDSLPDRIISAVANAPYVSDPKAVGPFDLRYGELVQNSESGNLTPSTTQSDGTTTLTDSRFAEILGLTAAPGSEAAQKIVSQKQRSWGTGVELPVTDPAGQKTEARMAALKIFDQFMNEFGIDNPGKDILWVKPSDRIAASSHTAGTGEPEELLDSIFPSQNTIPAAVLSQDGSTARISNWLGVPENRIIDHVIQQISIRSNPKQSSISIKLHPEELGHLKMELVANNETIKAHIHVQTLQAQDILEKNMARLHEGLEQQGLFLDEIKVSVNSESKNGPGLFNDQQTLHDSLQTANSTRTQESNETISEETMVASLRPDFIISLRI